VDYVDRKIAKNVKEKNLNYWSNVKGEILNKKHDINVKHQQWKKFEIKSFLTDSNLRQKIKSFKFTTPSCCQRVLKSIEERTIIKFDVFQVPTQRAASHKFERKASKGDLCSLAGQQS
jgi:hypothetical protein